MNYKLPTTFDSAYVNKLAILDHCREVMALQENLAICKAHDKYVVETSSALDHELVDLYLLLHNYLGEDTIMIQWRLQIFAQKYKDEMELRNKGQSWPPPHTDDDGPYVTDIILG